MKNNSLFRMKRSAKIGTFTFVLGVVVLAVLLVANLLVAALPSKITRFDTSGIGLTEISDETAKFVSGMKEDVTIYWLCEDGIEDDQFRLLLTRYEEAGAHVTVKVIDPLSNPTFTSKYTDSTLSAYSVIVESGRRHIVVAARDMYYYTNEFVNQYLYSGTVVPLTGTEFEELYNYCTQYYQIDISQYPTSIYFSGEAHITSALDYVTKEYIPHGYLLTGHGETLPSETLTELMASMNMDIQQVNLQVAQSVPADANCLILFSPQNDISAHEAALIKDYLNAGGSLMLTTSPELMENAPNIASVCALFGLSAAPGVVEEGDASYISGSRFTLVPTVNTQHTAAAYVSGSSYKAQMHTSHAITVAETLPAGVVATPLFTTSYKANRVSVADTSVTLGEAGKLHVAVAATKSVAKDGGVTDTAHLTWYGSEEAFTDKYAEATSGGNYYYYAATLSFMSESFSSAYEALGAVNLSAEYLSGLTNGSIFGIGIVIVLVIPVGLLVTGIVIWVRRKRR